jgi:branched-subunit amino acid aminotransferase/4-amino-4-deoxychorismate lyase
MAAIPRSGRWFPRVEYDNTGSPELRMQLRTAPPPFVGSIQMAVIESSDLRTQPRVKGPDLDLLIGLRQQVAALGCDEVLLRTSDGVVLEGALSGLLWWRDETLCLPALDLPVLPSVTAAIIVERADFLGLPVRRERCQVEDLADLEVWSVSALHGIRPVGGWEGAEVAAGPVSRSEAWNTWLAEIRVPIWG